MVINDTGSVEGIYAFIYCTKWRSGQVSRMPDSLTDSQTLKDSANQLFIKYKSAALVTQFNYINALVKHSIIEFLDWTATSYRLRRKFQSDYLYCQGPIGN